MSIFEGLSRPMRAAGLGLLAVAVIAAVIGGVTVVTGGDDTEPAAHETTQPADPDGNGNGNGNGDGDGDGGNGDTDEQSPTAGNGQDGNGADGQNGDGAGEDGRDDNGNGGNGADGQNGNGDGTGNGESADDGNGGAGVDDGGSKQVGAGAVGVRVYNNSTVSGLAHEAANDLRDQGWNVIEVGNYAQGTIPVSTVYYRPGTDEQGVARELGERTGMRVEERFDGIKDSSPGVIVIVTRDYADN